VWAIAMTEPGAGSDLQGITTRAVRDGDDYVVTGAKTFITNGYLADRCVVAVKTDPAQGARGISLLVVDLDDDAPGFRRGPVIHKLGLQGNDTGELFFDELRVPAANLLGQAEGLGFSQMMAQLPQERLVIGLLAVAAMDRAVELTVEYTRNRTAFGDSLFALQNTRFTLAECATLARVGRTFADDCIVRHARGELDVAGGRDGEVLAHRAAGDRRRSLPAAVRRVRLHAGVPDRPHVRRRPRPADLRRGERSDEGARRAGAVGRGTTNEAEQRQGW
jgi:acyl-CoA dehydrogenase